MCDMFYKNKEEFEVKYACAKRVVAAVLSLCLVGSAYLPIYASASEMSSNAASVPMQSLSIMNEARQDSSGMEDYVTTVSETWGEASPHSLATAYHKEGRLDQKCILEFRARVTKYAGPESLGAKIDFGTQRLMFRVEDTGHINLCTKTETWGKKTAHEIGTDWHTYQIRCNGTTAAVFIDGVQIAETELQSRACGYDFELWSGSQGAEVDYVKMSERAPIWNDPSAMVTVSQDTSNDTSVLHASWPAANGTSTGTYTVTLMDTLNEKTLLTKETTETEMTFTELQPGTGYNVQVTASNKSGTNTQTLIGYGDTAYHFSEDSGLSVKNLMVGGQGYHNYRIPCLVATKKGTLLAMAEARNSGSDWAPMDAVLMRSEDGGETWSEKVVMAAGERDGYACNNPILIPGVDDQGRSIVLLVYCQDYGVDIHKQGGVFVRKSVDDGKNWSEPVEITENCRPDYRNVVATGPGHGIQLQYNQDHKGRLVVSVWMVPKKHGKPVTSHGPAEVTTLYSDDYGETWKMGDIIPLGNVSNPNESTVVELSDGRVMINMRNTTGNAKRAISISPDGTTGWSEPYFDPALNCPVCFASLTRYDDDTILFVNPDTVSGRTHGTIKVSYDNGQTWPIKRMMNEGFSGYADVAVTEVNGCKEINVLFETVIPGTENNSLTLYRFPLSWVTEGVDGQLNSLKLSSGSVQLQRDVFDYDIILDQDVSEISVSASAFAPNASIKLNGQPLTNGHGTLPIHDSTTDAKLTVLVNNQEKSVYTLHFHKIPEVADDSCVLHYTMDDFTDKTMKDASGFFNNGTISGSITSEETGKFGSSANMKNGTVSVHNPNGLDFGKGDFTASLWINPENATNQQFLLWYGTLGTGEKAWWIRRNPNGSIQFLLGSNGEEKIASSEANLAEAGQWTNITAVRKNDTIKLYINGQEKAAANGVANFDLNGENRLDIGLDKSSYGRHFTGQMDELRIYNYALTEEQILALQKNEVPVSEKVQAVIDKIDAIGTVTLESEDAIVDAEKAFAALTPDEQALVSNQDVLAACREKFDALKAKEVVDQIAGIGTVTLDKAEMIRDIKSAFDALTPSQKKLVTNEDVLNAALDELSRLEDGQKVPDVPHYHPHAPIVPEKKPVSPFPFKDVFDTAWYYDSVYNAWENDLIDGMTADEFAPDSLLTVAQAIKLAAVLHQRDHLSSVTLVNGTETWFSTYVSYAVNNGIIDSAYGNYTAEQMNAPVSRSEFVKILHGAKDYYAPINNVADNAIPDIQMQHKNAAEIYEFYRAGVLTGSDNNGTFYPNANIKRSEVAAILVRMYDLSARQTIQLP